MKTLAIVMLMLSLVCSAHAESDADTVVQLVDKALDTFKTKGKEEALKLCNASMGPLRKGALYAFVVDFKGRMLGHPVQADLRQHDAWELQDAKGKFIVQEFIKIAKEQGQGWCDYWWVRVSETAPTLKKTYIKRVPGEDMLVGAGYYVK